MRGGFFRRMTATKINIPKPEAGESLERYTVRVGQRYRGKLDPDELNEAIWEAYSQANGPTDVERVAQQKFDPAKYRHIPGVCIFAEHKTTDSQGQPRSYGVKELYRIARANNARTEDVASFVAISDGHTVSPSKDNPRPSQPDVLGWAGNYRLGLIGRKNPRWAIFQDEYHPHETAAVLARKPQRSVELWNFPDGRAYINPVAALSSEAPRLPLPTKFQMVPVEGVMVERYSFDAASMDQYCGAVAGSGEGGTYTSPAGGNTHVPSFGKRPKRTRYAATPTNPKPGGNPAMPLDQNQIQEFLAILMETPAGKALDAVAKIPNFETAIQKLGGPMQGDDINEDEGDGSDSPTPGLAPVAPPAPTGAMPPGKPGLPPAPGSPPPAQPGAPVDDMPSDIDDLIGGGDEEGGEHAEPDGDEIGGAEPPDDTDEKCPHCGQKKPGGKPPQPEEKFSMANENAGTVERYAQLQKSHSTLIEDFARANQRLEALEKRAADAERYMQVKDLKAKYPEFIDLDEEASAILYSQGSTMTSEQVTAHLAKVEKYAEKAGRGSVYIPAGAARPTEIGPEKYSQEQQAAISKATVTIITNHNHAHPQDEMDWETGKAKAIAQLGL